MKAQVNLRLADSVHERLDRLGRAIDGQAPPGSEPTGKTGAAKLALLTGLAQMEAQFGLASPKPQASKRRQAAG
jgi:hypothetical protein